MDLVTRNCLSLLSCSLVFYYYYQKLLLWYLDQIPAVPKLTEPFEEIIELDTANMTRIPHTDPIGLSLPQRIPHAHPITQLIGMPIPIHIAIDTHEPVLQHLNYLGLL